MPEPTGLYTYQAEVTRVIDGDTVVADIDLGFSVWVRGQHLRLARINAPELSTSAGQVARSFLLEAFGQAPGVDPLAVPIYITTTKDRHDDYGRMLAEVLLLNGTDLNQVMLDTGHAVPYPAPRAVKP